MVKSDTGTNTQGVVGWQDGGTVGYGGIWWDMVGWWDGGMVGWWDMVGYGGIWWDMVGWQDGGMAGWWDGGMVGWQTNKRRTVASLATGTNAQHGKTNVPVACEE